jgi:aminoglycoside phosphotransferase (APT) family kinase protein
MELPPYATAAAIIQCHRDSLGLKGIDQIETALLGQGEANLNVLVTVNQAQRFNLRIGLREAESERTLQREYDVLQLVPHGIGPRAYVVDLSRTLLNQPYMLLDYLAGELKTSWDMADLEAHAHTLARLHQQTFVQHGVIGQLSDPPYDFLHRFDTGVTYWQIHHPYLLDIPVVQRLLPAIRQLISANADLFARLQRFTLVHGDAHPLNIFFQGDHVAYIDWEWAAIGDPAQDIAMLGWDVPTAWQMELTGERLDGFLAAYLALQPDATLRERRDLWMVSTMFFDQLYHRTQIPSDTTGRQAYTVQQIETYLTQRFL